MSNESRPGLPIPTLVVIGIVAFTLFNRQAPLDLRRPRAVAERPVLVGQEQAVPARLWEDPLRAFALARESAGKRAFGVRIEIDARIPDLGDGASQVSSELRSTDAPNAPTELVVVAMVPGGSYANDAETRKRTRYATLMALLESGYAPEDSRALGAFCVWERSDDVCHGCFAAPFERFRREGSEPGKWHRALVVWLRDDALRSEPARGLAAFVAGLDAWLSPSTPRYAVLGPTSSTDLVALLRDMPRLSDDSRRAAWNDVIPRTRLLSPRATISTGELAKAGLELPAAGARQLQIERVIGTDDELIRSLIDELGRRGVDVAHDHIALVTEWDTAYGRAFHESLKRCIGDHSEPHLTRHFFLQGIDGSVPNAANRVDDDPSESPRDGTSNAPDDTDRAIGRRQTDYLRRLRHQLVEHSHPYAAIGLVATDVYDKLLLLRALRPQFPKAVFFTTDLDARLLDPRENAWARNLVIASHFDLDPGLPDSTRDDGRGEHYHGATCNTTRILPFRDSYQTATFRACRRAIEWGEEDRSSPAVPVSSALRGREHAAVTEATHRASGAPVFLYEVARDGAFLLPTTVGGRLDKIDVQSWSLAGLGALAILAWIFTHAISLPTVPVGRWRLRALRVLGPLLGVLALAGIGWALYLSFANGLLRTSAQVALVFVGVVVACRVYSIVQGRLKCASREHPASLCDEVFLVGLPSLLVLFLLFGGAMIADWVLANGEPAALFQGLSAWPAIGTRLLLLGAAWWCMHFLAKHLRRNEHAIGSRYDLVRSEPQGATDSTSPFGVVLKAVRDPVEFMFGVQRPDRLQNDEDPDGAELRSRWSAHVFDSRRRVHRSIRASILCGLVAFFLYVSYEDNHALTRGAVAFWTDALTWGASLVVVAMVMFLALAATRSATRFVRDFLDSAEPTTWSRAARKTIGWCERAADGPRDPSRPQPHANSAYLDPLLDVRLAADLTAESARVVWLPFVLLSVLILVNNPYFEGGSWSWVTFALFGIGVVVMLAAEIVSRSTAERLRESALSRLRDTELALRIDDSLGRVDELTHAIEEVRSMRRGAFLPLVQHPIVVALVLPFGGIGTLAFLERFAA